jgi:lipid-A-disaccharide synthase-like uncharacterized protein
MIAAVSAWWGALTPLERVWIVIGFGGQALFMSRFLIQWIASERARRSVMPVGFWYFSLVGGITLFFYAIHRGDPVFTLGQAGGLVIYARNLYFIIREKRQRLLPDPLQPDDAAAVPAENPGAQRHGPA